ncbi:MAG: SRPBCC family protein [Promethearchaeota archaeon]
MPHVERKIEIHTPPNRIFDILDDVSNSAKWSLPVNEITEISKDKFSVKSTVGDFTLIRTETVEPEKFSMSIEGGIFNSMGYILNPKGDMVETTIWGDFDDEKNEGVLAKAGEILLESLKSYAEFLEEGGNADDFDKKQLMVSP